MPWMILLMGLLIWPWAAWGNTRLGLHVTTDELACWKQRAGLVTPGSLTPSCGTAASGGVGAAARYRVAGDVQVNSPGDWTRILAQADTCRSDSCPDPFSNERFLGNTTGVCQGASTPVPGDRTDGERLRDAAFVYMLTGDTRYRTTALAELVAQSNTTAIPGINWNNRTIWCTEVGGNCVPYDDNVMWQGSIWITKLAFAYDYLRIGDSLYAQTIPAGDKAQIENWLLSYPTFIMENTNVCADDIFPNRLSDDYTVTGPVYGGGTPCVVGNSAASQPINYFNGYNRWNFHEAWNNRRGTMNRAAGMIAAQFNNTTLMNYGKRYAKEWVRFSTYPNNSTFTQGIGWAVGVGQGASWGYNGAMVGTMVSLGDALCRRGDCELYTYQTTLGCGTWTPAGGPKSVWLSVLFQAKMMTGDVVVHATLSSAEAALNGGANNFRVDSIDEAFGEAKVTDTWMVPANLYFQDTWFNQAYRRLTGGITPQYPVSPGTGGYSAWGGEYGIYPGVLFMFGQLEGVVDPYTLNGGSPAPNAPTNLRVVNP